MFERTSNYLNTYYYIPEFFFEGVILEFVSDTLFSKDIEKTEAEKKFSFHPLMNLSVDLGCMQLSRRSLN